MCRCQKEAVVSQHSPVKKRVKENSPPQKSELGTGASSGKYAHSAAAAAVGSGVKKSGRSRQAIVIEDTPSPLLQSYSHSPRSIITISSEESDSDTEAERSAQWDNSMRAG